MNIQPIILNVDDINITGQLFLPEIAAGVKYPTVCICHGIPSGNPPDPNDGGYPALAEKICNKGFAVFIFNFRGSGTSGGNMDMLGWTEDLKAVIDYLYGLPEIDKTHLSVLGYSGGAAVSVFVTSQDERISSIMSCACPAEFIFPSASDTQSIIDHYRNIGAIRDKDFPESVEQWIANFDFIKPIKYVSSIAPRPLLLIHGDKDDVVHVSHAYRLHARAGRPKQLVIIEGGGHRLRRDEKTVTIITDWLKARLLK